MLLLLVVAVLSPDAVLLLLIVAVLATEAILIGFLLLLGYRVHSQPTTTGGATDAACVAVQLASLLLLPLTLILTLTFAHSQPLFYACVSLHKDNIVFSRRNVERWDTTVVGIAVE